MKDIPATQHPHRLRHYLAAGYTLLIVYASLSPFTGWHEQGLSFSAILLAPLWQTYSLIDAVVNLLAYLPFGVLAGLVLRLRFGAWASVLLATLCGLALSTAMEYAQMYLPMRTSSNFDLLTNSSGTLAGALLAATIAPSAWFARLAEWRLRLIHSGSSVDFGLALIALWMFAQINPSLPMLGNIIISEAARQPFAPPPAAPFGWLECTAIALNLVMLGCLLLTLVDKWSHAVTGLLLMLSTVALAKFVAAALLLKPWALLLWLNQEAITGMLAGLLLLLAASRLPTSWLPLCATIAAMSYLGLTLGMMDGAMSAPVMRMYNWKYGHLLTYNGLSQTILAAFPLLMLGYLWRMRARRPAAV